MSSRKHQQCLEFNATFEDIANCIREGHRTLVILRGVTGSGKSYLASQLANLSDNPVTFTSQHKESISKNVRKAMTEDKYLVIVDDHHFERSSIKKLTDIAISETYEFYVLEPNTPWKYDAAECKKRSNKDLDEGQIQREINLIETSHIHWKYLIGGEQNVLIQSFNIDVTSSLSPTTTSSEPSMTSPTQIICMKPTPKMRELRSISTQVATENIAHSIASRHEFPNPDYPNAGFEVHETRVVLDSGKSTFGGPERRIGTDGEHCKPLIGGSESDQEFSMLRAVFQQHDLIDIHHLFQIFGFDQTFRAFDALNEPKSSNVLPVDDRRLAEDLVAGESWTMSNVSAEDEINELKAQRLALWYQEKENCEDTSSDEYLAMLMQSDFEAEDKANEEFLDDRDFRNLSKLEEIFGKTDPEMIKFAYEASAKNVDQAQEILLDNGQTLFAKSPNKKKTFSNAVATKRQSVQVVKTANEKKNRFLSITGRNPNGLEDAQWRAVQIHKRLESEAMQILGNSGGSGSAILAQKMCSFRQKKLREVAKIDADLRENHSSPHFLDLHYMSVEGAVKLVKEAIEAVRYLQRRHTTKNVSSHINIVTGLGNNSKRGAKIKPAIINFISREGLFFVQGANEGSVKLKLK